MRPKREQVVRLDHREQFARVALLLGLHLGAEAEHLLADALLDDLVEALERAAADEQDVRGVDLR
jgi:hypothetical protein